MSTRTAGENRRLIAVAAPPVEEQVRRVRDDGPAQLNVEPRRLSVVFFSNSTARGGVEEHILTLARGLDAARFSTAWICPPALAAQVQPQRPAHLELIALELNQPRQLPAAGRLIRLLRRRRPDILHAHLFYASLFGSPLARLAGVPVVIETPHVRELWRHGWKSSYAIDRGIARAVDYFIAVSEANAEYLRHEKRLPVRKVVVIRNGCDLRRFDPDRAPDPGLRARLGLSGDEPVLLVMARLEPQKRHADLLAAMPTVLRQHPRAQLVLAGDGRLRGELESQCARMGIANHVHFVGHQNEVAPWLTLATLTVLPSWFEGLPLAALESLAAGRAVVASAVDGTTEVVRDGETGLTYPAGDCDRLTQALLRALADPAACRRWGAQGRRWVERHFDQQAQVSRTAALYIRAWQERQALVRHAAPTALTLAEKENRTCPPLAS